MGTAHTRRTHAQLFIAVVKVDDVVCRLVQVCAYMCVRCAHEYTHCEQITVASAHTDRNSPAHMFLSHYSHMNIH